MFDRKCNPEHEKHTCARTKTPCNTFTPQDNSLHDSIAMAKACKLSQPMDRHTRTRKCYPNMKCASVLGQRRRATLSCLWTSPCKHGLGTCVHACKHSQGTYAYSYLMVKGFDRKCHPTRVGKKHTRVLTQSKDKHIQCACGHHACCSKHNVLTEPGGWSLS